MSTSRVITPSVRVYPTKNKPINNTTNSTATAMMRSEIFPGVIYPSNTDASITGTF